MHTEEKKKQRNYEEDIKRLQSLRPIDDDFMRCIFKDNLPLVQKVLRVILDKPDLKLVKAETQVDMKRMLGARSICLDAVGEDEEGLPMYPIERMNVLLDKPFADGEHILYVNGAYRGDDDIGKLMHDFSCANPDEMIDSDMAEVTRYYKESEKGVATMCRVFDELREETRRETRREMRMNIAMELIALGEDSYEKIAKVTKLSLEEVKELAEGISA